MVHTHSCLRTHCLLTMKCFSVCICVCVRARARACVCVHECAFRDGLGRWLSAEPRHAVTWRVLLFPILYVTPRLMTQASLRPALPAELQGLHPPPHLLIHPLSHFLCHSISSSPSVHGSRTRSATDSFGPTQLSLCSAPRILHGFCCHQSKTGLPRRQRH